MSATMSATTAAAALLLMAAAGAGDDAAPCRRLYDQFSDRPDMSVRAEGGEVPVWVAHDGRAPARAAAALLLAALRAGARLAGPLAPAREWGGARLEPAAAHGGLLLQPAAARGPARADLQALGAGAAPAAPRLLAYLAPDAPAACFAAAAAWTFYGDRSALRACGFLATNASDRFEAEEATVYTLAEHAEVANELRERKAIAKLHWRFETRGRDAAPRGALRAALRGAASFLFVEHAVWAGAPRVLRVQPPPCARARCMPRLDRTPDTVFYASVDWLIHISPEILAIARNFTPLYSDLREILEMEADGFRVDGAACAWALRRMDRFRSLVTPPETDYYIYVFLCENDSELLNVSERYQKILDDYDVIPEYDRLRIVINVRFYRIDCTNDDDLTRLLPALQKSYRWRYVLGVVAKSTGSRAVTEFVDGLKLGTETALVLYSQTDEEAGPAAGWRGVGLGARRLAAALRRLLRWRGWRRVAVLAAEGPASAALLRELRAAGELRLLERPLRDAGGALRALRDADARVVLVLADAAAAGAVLCAAAAAGMAGPRHAWLTLARAPAGCGAPHLALEPAWRGQPLPAAAGRAALRERLRARCGRLCPPDAAPLLDALLLLRRASVAFLYDHPHRRHDLHRPNTTSALWSSLRAPVAGVSHELAGAEPAPLVFVSAWSAGRRVAQAVWRVRRDGVRELSASGEWPAAAADGGAACLARRSAFGRCLDWALAALAAACAAALPALLLARRARRARAARRERLLLARLLARERRAAAALAAHLVDRSALELRHELGAGRFGRVRFAVLRAPGRPPLAVAVKALPEDAAPAEESEFLREACTLAALRHDHVVRVLGVCVVDGPPLLLMEFAFFGDLAGYLRERRYLVERVGDEYTEEAIHVSPQALTNLARQAAAAVSYLALLRLVHRDVRASNCLVDSRRSLKLADFGMARRAEAGSDGVAEYACRRRGLFPVLWMAPESLRSGVFSPASDVWGLGMLMLELIMLGDRPYGMWSPLRVLRYVTAGGLPPLPADSSVKTRGVVMSCCRPKPEERPSAAEVAAYLADNPRALVAALDPPALDDRPASACLADNPRAPVAALDPPALDDRPASACLADNPRAPVAALQRPAPDQRPTSAGLDDAALPPTPQVKPVSESYLPDIVHAIQLRPNQ